MIKRGLMVLLVTAVTSVPGAGGVGEWRNYTSMKEVRAVARSGAATWAATSGGLFLWDESRKTFLELTSADGLPGIDLTAVAVDSLGNAWSGSSVGQLHVYSPQNASLRVFPSIANTDQSNKAINSLSVYGDTLLISMDFGLSVFRISKLEFGDSFTKFSTIPTGNRVTVLAAAKFQDRLWAAVTDGQTYNRVAVANLASPNLLPPDAWTLQVVGSPTVITKSLGVFDGRLYAGTTAGLYAFDGSTWVAIPALAGQQIDGLAASSTTLYVATDGGGVYGLDPSNTVTAYGPQLPATPTALGARPAGGPIVGSNQGLLTLDTAWSAVYPNGPNGNQFINVAVDPTGVLWGASGSANGKGFYRYNGHTWISFTAEANDLPLNEYYKMSVSCNGSVWASSWGRGVAEIPPGGTTVDSAHIFGTNVGMVGIPNDPLYVVVSNVVCDSRGTNWMSVGGAADKNILVARTADGAWHKMPVRMLRQNGPSLSTLIADQIDRALAVDASDNLWALVRDPIYKGVLSLANGGALDSVASYFLTTADGLPSNDVRTLVIDQDNTVWVGTDKGVGIILDPSNPTRSGAVAAYKPLSGNVINTIAVDALNQKWIGTTEGVVLLSPDGTQQLASYTVDNTGGKLISNDIRSIAIDPTTGTVYFGSVLGLASVTTPASAPVLSFDKISVYPNPFKVPSGAPLTIDGLVANSSIKILTIDGRLVRDILSPGGRVAFWDGTDTEGHTVSSGIYIVVAASEDGSQVAKGKVAVLRK